MNCLEMTKPRVLVSFDQLLVGSSPFLPDPQRLQDRSLSRFLAGCYASPSGSSLVSAGRISFQDTFSISPGGAPDSSRILPRGVRMARTSCCNLRRRIYARYPHVRRHRLSTSPHLCICRSGHGHSSASKCRLLLSPRISLPRGVCLRMKVLLPGWRPRLACFSRSGIMSIA